MPTGHYWPVAAEQDFAGQFAVTLADVVGLGNHSDWRRRIGCCGPSGSYGRNRVCGCGDEIGTERSDCIFPKAVYLDPSRLLTAPPDTGTDTAANGGT